MKAVFLCGGIGKRMFPITEDKFLLDFLGKPLLEHQIELARRAGIDDFVIIANPGNMAAIEKITTGIAGARFDYALQQESLGIADALKSAQTFLRGPFLLINPNDVFSGSACTDIIAEANRGTAISCMLGYRVEEYFPGGYLEVNAENDLVHIVEKPGPGQQPGDLVNILVHLHRDPEVLLRQIGIVQTIRDDVYECALDSMIRAGHRIKVIPYDGFWAPIKYPWHILKVVEHFLDGADASISPSARVSGRACIEGKVILGDNVRVLENAVIRGPAYVGPNSIIGNNALVRDYSHIGSGSVVGYCTEVKHSYIGDNCWFHSNYVGDSIIDNDCSLGAGTVLANFRLDEGSIRVKVGETAVDTGYDKLGVMMGRGCRVGINASIMPGLRVGSHSFIGPHVCLREDLQAHRTALADPGYRVTDNDTSLGADKRRDLLDRLK